MKKMLTESNREGIPFPVMKITTEKEGRAWKWEITRNGEYLAGGYCKTKADAQSDAKIKAGWIESDEARKAGRIAAGDSVEILPEWQDKGDENYSFIAYDTQLEGMTEIRVCATHKATGKPAIGLQSVRIEMLKKA